MKHIGWGMIGGGEGSQIGFAHRAASGIDGLFLFAAGALDVNPGRAKEFGRRLGLAPDRAYGDWKEMLAGERKRDDRVSLVTVATPNATHFEISKSFLEEGFHVLCEKPMTLTIEEGKALVEVAKRTGQVCAVNYGYSGYPMVRHMRAMVARGDLGKVRVAMAEFAGGFMADTADADNPRVRWRFDPAQAGVSAVTLDAGIHALHLACYVTSQKVKSVSADFANGIAGRQLEDDSLIAFRMEQGAIGRLWSSGLAIGRTHGLALQVFGEKGGLRWTQEQPNQLYWTELNKPTMILERGASNLSPEAERANRITVGHAEGMVMAFGNIYRDLADIITSHTTGEKPNPLAQSLPRAEDGLHSIEIVHAAARSARNLSSAWVTI